MNLLLPHSVHTVCNKVEVLNNVLFCLSMRIPGSFHCGEWKVSIKQYFVSCDIGWKRCNTFKTDWAQAIQIARKCVVLSLKRCYRHGTVRSTQYAPNCNWVLKEIMKIGISKSWLLSLCSQMMWEKMAVFAELPFLLRFTGCKGNVLTSFWKGEDERNISSWR